MEIDIRTGRKEMFEKAKVEYDRERILFVKIWNRCIGTI